MTSRGNWDRETGRLLKRIDIPDLSDQLDGVRDYLKPPMAQRAPSTRWKRPRK
jgi:hypothetical protein